MTKRRALAANGLRINSHSGYDILVISTLRTDWVRLPLFSDYRVNQALGLC